MSRYKLEPRADRKDVDHAIVGWDRPLETFFAQVFSKASPDEDPIVWVGADYGELRTPEAAIAAVEAFAIIPEGTRAKLLQDYADGPSRPPGRQI